MFLSGRPRPRFKAIVGTGREGGGENTGAGGVFRGRPSIIIGGRAISGYNTSNSVSKLKYNSRRGNLEFFLNSEFFYLIKYLPSRSYLIIRLILYSSSLSKSILKTNNIPRENN